MVIGGRRAAVILDLDDTLVDTRELRGLRERRDWKRAVRSMHQTKVFPGVRELLTSLSERGTPWAIVTTSVSYYAGALLRHHDLGTPPLVAYHDARPKPHPACVLKALEHLEMEPGQAVGLGDHRHDHTAYSACGVLSLGAGWSPMLDGADWDSVLSTPAELLEYL